MPSGSSSCANRLSEEDIAACRPGQSLHRNLAASAHAQAQRVQMVAPNRRVTLMKKPTLNSSTRQVASLPGRWEVQHQHLLVRYRRIRETLMNASTFSAARQTEWYSGDACRSGLPCGAFQSAARGKATVLPFPGPDSNSCPSRRGMKSAVRTELGSTRKARKCGPVGVVVHRGSRLRARARKRKSTFPRRSRIVAQRGDVSWRTSWTG
ncbi:hypothetical protein NA57DRAFT_55056 [Rhizodiscina lignyota]|uniref:Uncharacterized protein n=1 Tax=Rhizodiscina lignyota TaxID=1504668 RepID=A0A9P4IJU9_9PEZI|nr:hypothetical protein NA57DRAFT_55056 [Rhizodiscina lignyota]